MNISTRFDMGQHVYGIARATVERLPVPCTACEDGSVLLRGELFPCPKCGGKRAVSTRDQGWVGADSGTVGQIRAHVEIVDPHTCFEVWEDEIDEGQQRIVHEYMISSTGIGSGRIWREGNLFATREEAQAECDRRNGYRVERGREVGEPSHV